jgi:hypothetical protein
VAAVIEPRRRDQFQQLLRWLGQCLESLAYLDARESLFDHRDRHLAGVPRIEANLLDVEHADAPLDARPYIPVVDDASWREFDKAVVRPLLIGHAVPKLPLPHLRFRRPEERQNVVATVVAGENESHGGKISAHREIDASPAAAFDEVPKQVVGQRADGVLGCLRQQPGRIPVAPGGVPLDQIYSARFLLVPHIEEVAFERCKITFGGVRHILLANLLDVEEAAVLLQARVCLHPGRRVRRIVFLCRAIDPAVELRIGNDARFDLAGLFVQPPCQRRFVLHARRGDRDGQRLLTRDAAVRQHVPVLNLFAGLPAVELVRNHARRIDTIAHVAVGRNRCIEGIGVRAFNDPVRAAENPEPPLQQRRLLDHLAGGSIDVHRLSCGRRSAVDLASLRVAHQEDEQNDASGELRLTGLLRCFEINHFDDAVPGQHLPDVLESIEDFLQYECNGLRGEVAKDFACAESAAWLESLTPKDFAGRLKAVVGKDPWHHSMREDISGIPSVLIPLAGELYASDDCFETALPYLNSTEAASAGLLGDAFAQFDTDGRHMDRILEAAVRGDSNAFAGGYIGRLLIISPGLAAHLNQRLDRLEDESPVLAFNVGLAAHDHSYPLSRTLRMIESGKLPVQTLKHFQYGVILDHMSPADLCAVLATLSHAGDAESLHIAVDFVGNCLQKQRPFEATEREAMWRVLESSAPVEDRADYWWTRALQAFGEDAPERACDVALLGLTGKDYEKSKDAWNSLSLLAMKHPDLVMQRIGAVLLDATHHWRIRSRVRGGLFQVLPTDVVRRWLDTTGVEGARVIASHLASPSIDVNGSPLVHPLTEYVLSTWGDDEEVFERFAVSTHHLQLYTGDMAAAHRREAERARPLLSHRVRAIRRWAENEVAMGERQARQWVIRNEEQGLN